jgi:hypothetical protein
MWGFYSWEYFSQNFMSENCRVVNQQDIDRDREVCLYWAICNMIWKLSWCTYGNCFLNPITKTKIASLSHSPISTKLALLWNASSYCYCCQAYLTLKISWIYFFVLRFIELFWYRSCPNFNGPTSMVVKWTHRRI